MAKYLYTSSCRTQLCHSLVLILTILALLSGCDTSTTVNSSHPVGSTSTSTLVHKLQGVIREFPLPANSGQPTGITAGPDGAVWFTAERQIGRITSAGKISQFPLPPGIVSIDITSGPDSNLWFTALQSDKGTGKIGRISSTGKITLFSLPSSDNPPLSIVRGPDGNLWFTPIQTIGRISPVGKISQFPLPTAISHPGSITVGPDGNLWFTEIILLNQPDGKVEITGKVGRISPTGQLREFSLPLVNSQPNGITSGPDGALWFAELFANGQTGKIGRITTGGQISQFPLPIQSSEPNGGITSGLDGALWFTELVPTAQKGGVTGKIGRITPAGQIREFTVPTAGSQPGNLIIGPDGNLWFTDLSGSIGRLS